MIGKLRQIFEDALSGASPAPSSGHDLRVATAALLLEMARADREQAPEERRSIVALVGDVAAADGVFEKHEQHLLSKLADLLHLRKSEYGVIRASVLARVGKERT